MSSPAESLESAALKLPAEQRAQLADRLIASLPVDGAIDEAWAVEVERRIANIEAGRSHLSPASDVIARARDALK